MLLSFTTLTLLLVQNSFSFSEMTKQMELNLEKNNLIDEVASLTEFITALQTERVTVAQGLFISMSSGGSVGQLLHVPSGFIRYRTGNDKFLRQLR